TTLALLFPITVLVTVTQCRVTFHHSDVLQQTDLDVTRKTAFFKCDNGCFIYSDSQSPDMYINDGTRDVSNFLMMGAPNKSNRTELVPSQDYRLVFKGAGTPPRFVFYAVDKTAPYGDTPVYANSQDHGYLAYSALSQRFTLLSSYDDPPPLITFKGDFETGYPRVYATGFDATNEPECKPVYQARSQESALNSGLTINSPILTVDKGPSTGKVALQSRKSGAIGNQADKSSLVYISPGYVGCLYIQNQIYSSETNYVLDNFNADVNSLDLDASFSIPAPNEAVHITVNKEVIE
ncbi:hypothetical protein PENTCL1PPCAC_13446, partial [Pristionchus entomophagus]